MCGKDIYRAPSQIRPGQKFHCSYKCRSVSNTLAIELVCSWCGKKFLRVPSKIIAGTNPYCSHKCSGLGNRVLIDDNWLIEQYVSLQRTTLDIAAEIGTDRSVICDRLERLKVPRRDISRAKTGRPVKPMSTEGRKHLADATRKSWKDHERRKQMSDARKGEGNPAWKGGISFEPYCIKFNEDLRESVRASFEYKCFVCGSPENGRKLSIHHVDYQKSQGCKGLKWSLIPLCVSCHSKTNHKRWHWFALLRDYWIYNHINFSLSGLDID